MRGPATREGRARTAETPPAPAATWTTRILRVVLTVGVTWLILDRVGITLESALSVSGAIPRPSPLLLGASVGVLLVGFGVSAWLWGRMVREFGSEEIRLSAALRIVLTANLGRYLPGKLWQIAGLAALARRAGIGVGVATAAAVLGQGFSLVGAAVLGAPMLFGQELGEPRTAYAALGLLFVVILLASVPAVLRWGIALAIRVTRGDPSSVPPISASFGPRWLALYLLGWTLYGGAFVLFVRGLGLGGDTITIVSGFSAAYLMGYIAVFAPAGLGVREGFLVAFLQPSIGSSAVALAVLTRLWMTAVELVPAAGFAIWEIRRSAPGAPSSGGGAEA